MKTLTIIKTAAILAIVSSAVFGLSGCKPATVVSKTDVGKILDANFVPTSFNDADRTQIKTEKIVVTIRGDVAVPKGVEAYTVVWSDGDRTIEWEGGTKSYSY